MSKNFKESVLDVVKAIPAGKTLSYKEVAIRAGSPKAYRAVGNILKSNFNPNIPCHRVIKSNGQYGEYNRGKKRKIEILNHEKLVEQKGQ